MAQRVRILVVEPTARITLALLDVLPTRGSVAIVGRADDAAAASAALAAASVDLVVVDVDRPDGWGYDRIAGISTANGAGRVLAASLVGGPDVAVDALTAGACGILPLAPTVAVVDACRRALGGELILPADDLTQIVDHLTSPAPGGGRPGLGAVAVLTPRERDILRTLAAGASTSEVAEAFGISPLTVQSHVKNILAKLGVHSKVEAVRLAWRHGLASPSRSATG